MEEKTIVNLEMENRPPIADSSWVDDWPNQKSVDSTEVGHELDGRVYSQQSQEPIVEQ